jgi:hypothetical protein
VRTAIVSNGSSPPRSTRTSGRTSVSVRTCRSGICSIVTVASLPSAVARVSIASPLKLSEPSGPL